MLATSLSRRRGKTRGFTLLEVLAVLVVIGILLKILWPNVSVAKANAEEANMKAKAVQMNDAMGNYVTEYGLRAALTTWPAGSGAAVDEARYQLVRRYLQYSTPTLADFMMEGYTLNFPVDPRTKVVVNNPDGVVLIYH